MDYNIKIDKLAEGVNYYNWREDLTSKLILQGYEVFIDRQPNKEDKKEIESDKKSRAIIVLHVDAYYKSFISELRTTKEVWDEIGRLHVEKDGAQYYNLTDQLYKINLEPNESIYKYAARINDLRSRLIDCSNPSDRISTKTFITCMLRGLPPEYESIVNHLRNSDLSNFTITDIVSKLLSAEQIVKEKKDKESFVPIGEKEYSEKAMFAGNRFGTRGVGPSNWRGSNPEHNTEMRGNGNRYFGKFLCHFCDKPGHKFDDCFEKKQYMKDKKEREGESSGKYAMAVHESSRDAHGKSVTFALLMSDDYISKYDWILDSGATYHITNDKSCMINIVELDDPIIIQGAGSETFFAKIMGDLYVGNILLKNVLYVPEIKANLLSVPVATRNGAAFMFNKYECHITYGNTKIAQAIRTKEGLYRLFLGKTKERNVHCSDEIKISIPDPEIFFECESDIFFDDCETDVYFDSIISSEDHSSLDSTTYTKELDAPDVWEISSIWKLYESVFLYGILFVFAVFSVTNMFAISTSHCTWLMEAVGVFVKSGFMFIIDFCYTTIGNFRFLFGKFNVIGYYDTGNFWKFGNAVFLVSIVKHYICSIWNLIWAIF